METSESCRSCEPSERTSFETTHWSVVLAARDRESSQAAEALTTLCRRYWYPLYAFVRRQGVAPFDAQDLIQGFFLKLLSNHYLDDVDRAKGKFRSFLLSSLKHFMANEWKRARAKKRGGGRVVISIDRDDAESRYTVEPSHDVTPERLYDRRWALDLLDQSLARLHREYEFRGKGVLFEQLKTVLTEGKGSVPYADMATELEMSETAVKAAAHRLRRRYRDVLREEVRNTVSEPEQVEDELQHMITVLST